VRSPKPDPKLIYHNRVDQIYQELDQELGLEFSGVIEDDLDRASLDTLRDRLQISLEEAKALETQVQQPYLVRAKQRRQYADHFRTAVKNGHLPSDRARRRLTEIRQDLLLGEEDADRIEQILIQQLDLKPVSVTPTPAAPASDAPTAIARPPEPEINQPPEIPSRYANLEKYLKTPQWREADQETYRLMITTIGKEEGQWFDLKDLETFPCEDLRTLDQLWVKYSNGKWGFSVQKRIWEECGSPRNYNKDWETFGDRVGWRKNWSWVSYDNLSFNLENSLNGEFPRGWCWVGWWGGGGFSSLAQRLVDCSTRQS
jgi:hypothetical protein